MRELLCILIITLAYTLVCSAQFFPPKFGNGFRVLGKDSTFISNLDSDFKTFILENGYSMMINSQE